MRHALTPPRQRIPFPLRKGKGDIASSPHFLRVTGCRIGRLRRGFFPAELKEINSSAFGRIAPRNTVMMKSRR
jgi:hypothetical protein